MSEKRPKKLLRTGYISELEKFMRDFDKNRQFPPERLREIAKHKKIFDRRDRIVDDEQDLIWKSF